MSEKTFTLCDFCNKEQNTHLLGGRGYAFGSENYVVDNLDWRRMPEGRVMCIECQEDRGLI